MKHNGKPLLTVRDSAIAYTQFIVYCVVNMVQHSRKQCECVCVKINLALCWWSIMISLVATEFHVGVMYIAILSRECFCWYNYSDKTILKIP